MFVESEFSWTIMVQPDQFSISDLQVERALMKNLLKRFNNTKCTEAHGYFVAITGIERVGEGIIREGKGYITYPVLFRGLTYIPLTGEIVYGKVSTVSELGVIADCGPEQLAITVKSGDSSNMGNYKYHKEDKVWKHKVDGRQIKQGTAIRAEIAEITWLQHLKSFQTYCNLKRDFLGAIELL